jgi:hypothetical protein
MQKKPSKYTYGGSSTSGKKDSTTKNSLQDEFNKYADKTGKIREGN